MKRSDRVYKKDLIAEISDATGYTEKACEEFLDAFISCINEYTDKGKAVQITRFGTFCNSVRKGREYIGFDGKTYHQNPVVSLHFTPGVDSKAEWKMHKK